MKKILTVLVMATLLCGTVSAQEWFDSMSKKGQKQMLHYLATEDIDDFWYEMVTSLSEENLDRLCKEIDKVIRDKKLVLATQSIGHGFGSGAEPQRLDTRKEERKLMNISLIKRGVLE